MDNNSQIILITGASSGMGKATARRLIEEGHTVYAAARRIEKMEELEKMGGHPLSMDITREADVRKVVDTIVGEQGRIDVLVNNAGYAVYGAVEDTDIDDARRQFEVNLFGLGRLTQLVLPGMREQEGGRIINVSSMGGKIYTPLGAWYHASKHALEGWSDCLRLELKPFGIDVVLIEPGIIETEFAEVMMNPLLERSGEGPYGDMAQKVAKATEESYAEGNGSSPEVVARVISKAIRKKKPGTRYSMGHLAKPMIYLRKFLPDRWFDKLVMSQV